MKFKIWSWAESRKAVGASAKDFRRELSKLENGPMKCWGGYKPSAFTIDPNDASTWRSIGEEKWLAFDIAAISRIEFVEGEKTFLALDTVPVLDPRKPSLDANDDQTQDRTLWPTLAGGSGDDKTTWRTFRAGAPQASYLRIIKNDNDVMASLKLHVALPFLPVETSVRLTKTGHRAKALEDLLLGSSSVFARIDWAAHNFGAPSGISSLCLSFRHKSKLDGLVVHSGLVDHATQSSHPRDNYNSGNEDTLRSKLAKQADGEHIISGKYRKDRTLGESLVVLGEKIVGEDDTPEYALTRYGLEDCGLVFHPGEKLGFTPEFLGQLGLDIKPNFAPNGPYKVGAELPLFHFLTRLSYDENGGEDDKTEGFEWLAWVPLAHRSDPERVTASLIRVRQKPTGEVTTDQKGTLAAYTITVEGVSGEHVMLIWSKLVAEPARARHRRENEAGTPSFLPNVSAVTTEGETERKFVIKLDCERRVNGPEFYSPAQATARLQGTEIRSVSVYEGSFIAGKENPFPKQPPVPPAGSGGFNGAVLPAARLEFPDLFGSDGKPLKLATGGIRFSGAFDLQRGDDGRLSPIADIDLEIDKVKGEGSRSLTIAGFDIDIVPALKDPLTLLRVKSDLTIEVAETRVEIRTLRVLGSDIDSDPGRLPEKHAAVWATRSAKKLLTDGILSFEQQNAGERQEARCRVFRLKKASSSDEPYEVAIVAPSPFFVGTVSLRLPDGTGSAGDDELLAEWRSGERRWRMQWDGERIPDHAVRLPAQGIAEDWERTNQKDADGQGLDGIIEEGRVPARFTRPATIKIASEERRRAALVPWNLLETITEFASDLPGARLTEIERLEVLYGLEAHGAKPTNVRVADTEGWFGRPVLVPAALKISPPSGTTSSAQAKGVIARARGDRWERSDAIWSDRLSVIEARKDRPSEASLIEVVRHRLRDRDNDGAQYRAPPNYQNEKNKNWWSENGTTGGVFGGFERKEVIDALIRDHEKGRGEVRKLAFTPHGATIDGDSVFGTGLTKITYKSEFGRITEARFEREGRISWFRHRARHVIVYRRRATPGLQFGNEQDKNLNRLMMRKDEEFVELLDSSRDFPGRTSGPLEKFVFRDTKIPVHGAWSSGLDEDLAPKYRGYSVPLWRREADPDIYPRPDCTCVLSGPEGRTVPRSVANPEIIRFYSLTEVNQEPASGDPEQWPNVYGVDYADRWLGEPMEAAQTSPTQADFGDPTDPAAKLPDEELVRPGLEEFTLLLEPGEKVNVAGGRESDPVYADLRSIVPMRAKQANAPGAGKEPIGAAAEMQAISTSSKKLFDFAARTKSPFRSVDELRNEIGELRAKVSSFTPDPVLDPLTELTDKPIKTLSELETALEKIDTRGELDTLWKLKRSELERELAEAERALGALLPIKDKVFHAAERVLGTDTDGKELTEVIAEFFDSIEKDIDEFERTINQDIVDAQGSLKKAIEDVEETLKGADVDFAKAKRDLGKLDAQLVHLQNRLVSHLRKASQTALPVERFANRFSGRLPGLAQAGKLLAKKLREAPILAQVSAPVVQQLRGEIAKIITWVELGDIRRAEAAKAVGNLWFQDASEVDIEPKPTIAQLLKLLRASTARLIDLLWKELEEVEKRGKAIFDAASAQLKKGANSDLDDVNEKAREFLRPLFEALRETRQVVVSTEPPEVLAEVADAAKALHGLVYAILTEINKIKTDLNDALLLGYEAFGDLKTSVEGWLEEAETALQHVSNLEEAYDEVADGLAQFGEAAEQFGQGLNALLDVKARKQLLGEPVKPDNLEDATLLAVLRAGGGTPELENLIFNRDQIAYHYRQEYERVIVTPMTTLLDQGGEVLRAFGVTEPVLGIDGELLSPIAGAFDDFKGDIDEVIAGLKLKADDILKDLAGIKKLFPQMDYDTALARAISIRHGYEAASGQAWLSATLDHRIKREPIFEQEMFALVAENARLTAQARFEQPILGGEQSATSDAQVQLDLVFMVGGSRLLAAREAKISFDDRGLKFDIRPEKIEFNRLLKLISDAIKDLFPEESPLQLELLVNEDGSPIGVASRYDLPPVSFGPILNAALGVHLGLAQRENFQIESFAYLGRRDAPFALVYGILGGGGYIEARSAYIPATGATDLAISISMGASAGTGFAFGPLKGSVSIYLGFTLNYISSTGGERLTIGAVLVINGSISAWGIVTVNLNVRLAITYDGRELVGVGTIRVTVKVSRFYKKKFRRKISYKP